MCQVHSNGSYAQVSGDGTISRANHRLTSDKESGRQSFGDDAAFTEGRVFRAHAPASVVVLCTSRWANWHHMWPFVERFLGSEKAVSAVDKIIAIGGPYRT